MRDQERARLKLAGTYLVIIMTMSIVFSFVLYGVSSNQLDRNLRRFPGGDARREPMVQLFEDIRQTRLEESRAELQKKLILFNISTLICGSLLSYVLAREALRPIEESVEAQKRFTSDASHELRTPLTAMRSEIEVALRDKKLTAKESKSVLSSNLEEIQKLEALTGSLLQLARQGYKDVQPASFSVKQVIIGAVNGMKPNAKQKKITVNTEKVNDIYVLGESESLKRVVLILLDNAVKYSSDKSIITIGTITNKNGVGFFVQDQGSGISKKDLPHIFDRFYRADTSRTRATANENNGYGLGLAIAKQIVDAHQGSIEVASQLGKGTTITVLLPKLS
jgi:signal transduction histidine kinase